MPPLRLTLLQRVDDPSMNVTGPVSGDEPSLATVAVKVTVCPVTLGLTFDARDIVVGLTSNALPNRSITSAVLAASEFNVTEPCRFGATVVGANSTPRLQLDPFSVSVVKLQVVIVASRVALTSRGAARFRSVLPSLSNPSITGGEEILVTLVSGNCGKVKGVANTRRMRLLIVSVK